MPSCHLNLQPTRRAGGLLLSLGLLGAWFIPSVHASTAYGSLNNFDTVNDTGEVCHGFEIELEDLHTADVTYTFDWNHYGTPRLGEDIAADGHPRTLVRWESGKNSDGSWAAHTAVPTSVIAPTDGHQFTDPGVNFGGEHFGVGYRVVPTAVRYYWLVDDGAGHLVRGPQVLVSTPVFFVSPAPGGGVQVQAEIPAPPEAPEAQALEFGKPVWVKEIRTTSHNDHKVGLRDLVSDDPDREDDANWRNNEPDEVEVEWQLLQEDFNSDHGGENGELKAGVEDLPDGDEVVTRRYEFYAYIGPLDTETGEARASKVGPDGVHGEGTKTIDGEEVDLGTVEVVGHFLGAQMAAMDAAADLGLIDHLADGTVGEGYPARTIVIAGTSPFTAAISEELPPGMSFDPVAGTIAGTPSEAGVYQLTVTASDPSTPLLSKTYTLHIAEPGAELIPRSTVETSVDGTGGGTVEGGGSHDNGTVATVSATPDPGHVFVKWTEQGELVSAEASYTFPVEVNRALVAHFAAPPPTLQFAATPGGGLELTWPVSEPEWILKESASLETAGWVPFTGATPVLGGRHHATIDQSQERRFFRLQQP